MFDQLLYHQLCYRTRSHNCISTAFQCDKSLIRKAADRFPLFSTYKSWTGLGFLLSLSALPKAGVSLREALEMLERRSPPYVAERLQAVVIPTPIVLAWPSRQPV